MTAWCMGADVNGATVPGDDGELAGRIGTSELCHLLLGQDMTTGKPVKR